MARVKVPIAVIDPAGNAVAGATVTVKKRSDGTNATLYVAETGPTTTTNPTATDSVGRVQAWIDRGSYRATISGTGITEYDQDFEAAPASDRGIDDLWLPSTAVPAYVTTLPVSPVDGQEVYYAADAANGVIWHLRYRSGATGSYKWEFIGGPPISAEVSTFETRGSGGYADLATVGPSITLPLAGDYMVEVYALLESASGGAAGSNWAEMSYAIGATAALSIDGISIRNPTTTAMSAPGFTRRRKAGLAAGTVLLAKYAASNTSASFSNRRLLALPVRVG